MRLVALVVLAGAVAGTAVGARPVVSFGPRQAAPGDYLSVRVAGLRLGPARLMLTPGPVAIGLPFRVSRRGSARFHAAVPNVPPGDYRLSVVRRGRTLARAARPLRITDPPPARRGCETSVWGNLGDGWERSSIRAGPVWFVGVARGFTRHVVGQPSKVLVMLDNGSVATVRVADTDRRDVALLYATRGGRGNYDRSLRAADGLPAVRFTACQADGIRPHTQFNGGFIADRHLCAHLEVHVPGRPEPIPVAISFGAPC